MKIKDYIFYRMYINYKKANEDGVFRCILGFTTLEYCLFLPITVLVTYLLSLEGRWQMIPFFTPAFVFFLLNYKRYYKKGRVVEIIKRYKNSKYNTIIKNWMIYIILISSTLWGFFSVYYFLKLIAYIMSIYE